MFVEMMLAAAILQEEPAPTPPPRPPVCQSDLHDDFDFWVGEWEVTPNREGAEPAAHSRIEKLYNGCAVRENWMPFQGTGGGSLNSVRPDGRWHQRWIGSGGETVDFVGGSPEPGKMVLTGLWVGYNGPGEDRLVRMSYTLREDGSVRQHGEGSTDYGLSWSTGFDLIYRPTELDAD